MILRENKPALPGIAVLLILLAGLVSGCATDRAVIGQANQFHGTLEPAVMRDEQLHGYIDRVGQRIIDAAREYHMEQPGSGKAAADWMFSQRMRFHLVNSQTINAFTTGGEHMYIYSELFRQARTEDELAAVMAHEFAHVYGRHVHKGINRQYAILGAAAAAGAGGYAAGGREKGGEYAGLAAGAAMLAGQFVGMGYTRRDEAEADALGFEFYVRAGWDPARFGDFFQQMIDKGYDKGPEYLSDHPSLASRAEAARRRAESLPPQAVEWRTAPVAAAGEFARLQRRAAEVGRSMPDDRTLAQTQHLLAAMPRSCLTPAIQEDQKQAEVELLRELQPPGGTRSKEDLRNR